MSDASTRTGTGNESRIERSQPWIAGTVSALVHLLMLMALLWSSKMVMTQPQGAASGSRMRVQYIGDSRSATPPPPSPPPVRPPTPNPPAATAARQTPPPTTRRPDAEAVLPPEQDPTQKQAPPSAAQAAPPAERHPERWTGRPPGMIEEDLAPENTGQARGPAVNSGTQRDITVAEPSMEAGGYQVYYDLRNEMQVRAWKAQGMTELFLPLPGTKRMMVCSLQTALNRGSGKCRLLEPDSPELEKIGDMRKVLTIQDVYRRGERVWSGPGAYR